MSKTIIDDIIDHVMKAEGGYVNDPNDAGGETNFGITIAVARANGYSGPMRDMDESFARKVYMKQYVIDPGFDKIYQVSKNIGAELIDTGVNCGVGTAGKFLQQSLNAFNNRQAHYNDLLVDGNCGQKTVDALKTFIALRALDGERVMMTALNCLQGAYYIQVSQAGEKKNENFVYGWIKNRVSIW